MLANKMSWALIFCRHVIIMDLLIRLTGLLEFHNVPVRNRRLEMSTSYTTQGMNTGRHAHNY